MSAFTTIRTTRTAAEADALIAALRAAGLHPNDLATFSHFSIGGFEGSYAIVVPTEEAWRAKEILRAEKSEDF